MATGVDRASSSHAPRVLLVLDAESPGPEAITEACRLARRLGAGMLVVLVLERDLPWKGVYLAHLHHTRWNAQAIARWLRRQGVIAESRLLEARSWEAEGALAALVDEVDPDLVAVVSRVHRWFGSWREARLARALRRHTLRPVAVIADPPARR